CSRTAGSGAATRARISEGMEAAVTMPTQASTTRTTRHDDGSLLFISSLPLSPHPEGRLRLRLREAPPAYSARLLGHRRWAPGPFPNEPPTRCGEWPLDPAKRRGAPGGSLPPAPRTRARRTARRGFPPPASPRRRDGPPSAVRGRGPRGFRA